MLCDVCDVIELELLDYDDEEIIIDVDFKGEIISGSTGEEYQNGYDKGYSNGKTDGYNEGHEAGYTEGYKQGEKDGKGIDLMSYITNATFSNAISEVTDDIYLDLSNATTVSFRYVDLSTEKITIKLTNKLTNMNQSFRSGNVDNLKEIEFVNNMGWVTSWNNAFSQRKVLERITGEIDLSSATTVEGIFGNCYALQTFTPKANTIKLSISFSSSPDLTDETIQAIIDGFADMSGQTAPVLSVHPEVKAKIEANATWLNTLINKNVTLA